MAIDDRLSGVVRQIGAVATGVSDEEYGIATDTKFDLNAEAQALVEPFIAMLRDATENARQIERLRRDLSEAKRRKALADRALSTLKPMRDIADEMPDVGGEKDDAKDLIETLDQRRALWEARANAESDLAGALQQQLDDRLSDRGASQTAAGEAASSFVKDRGISLLMGIGAFAIVFGVMRLLHRTARWLRMRRRIKPESFVIKIFGSFEKKAMHLFFQPGTKSVLPFARAFKIESATACAVCPEFWGRIGLSKPAFLKK